MSKVNTLPPANVSIVPHARNGNNIVNGQLSIAAQLFVQMALKPGERVLDLNCGSGSATRMAAQAVAGGAGMAAGLDISPEQIAQARSESRDLDNVLFAIGDAEEIPWRDEYFDKTFSLTSFSNNEHPQNVLRELHRVLVPGGLLHSVISLDSVGDCEPLLRAGGFVDTAISAVKDGSAMLLVARKP